MAKKFKVIVELSLTFEDSQDTDQVREAVDKHAQTLLETIPEVDDGYVEVTSCEPA